MFGALSDVRCRDSLGKLQPCASYSLGFGTGRRRTRSGHPKQRWPQEVSSCAIDDGERLVLFDPLAVPQALLALAREREPVIVLTAPWHERDARALVKRLDAALFAPRPDTAQDLIGKYGISAEQAGDGSPDLEWLRGGGDPVCWYGSGDRLPVGIEAHAAASTTTSCCGSRVCALSSPVIRLSTSERAWH
jgi:hypothetical protein